MGWRRGRWSHRWDHRPCLPSGHLVALPTVSLGNQNLTVRHCMLDYAARTRKALRLLPGVSILFCKPSRESGGCRGDALKCGLAVPSPSGVWGCFRFSGAGGSWWFGSECADHSNTASMTPCCGCMSVSSCDSVTGTRGSPVEGSPLPTPRSLQSAGWAATLCAQGLAGKAEKRVVPLPCVCSSFCF